MSYLEAFKIIVVMNSRFFVFDAYGTLFKVATDQSKIFQWAGEKSLQVQELWRQRQLEYTWLQSLMNRWINFDQITENALEFAMESLDLSSKELRSYLLDIYRSPSIFDDVLPFLKSQKQQKVGLFIASNGTRELLEHSIKWVGMDRIIDGIISADDVQVFKVSPEYYQMIPDRCECKPSDITFFSSNSWDIAGAAHFGFNTVWVNRKDMVFERLGVSPGRIISSFSEF